LGLASYFQMADLAEAGPSRCCSTERSLARSVSESLPLHRLVMIFVIANAPEYCVGVSDHRNKHGSCCPKTPVTRTRIFQIAQRQLRSPSGMPAPRLRPGGKVDTPVLLTPLRLKMIVSVGREGLL